MTDIAKQNIIKCLESLNAKPKNKRLSRIVAALGQSSIFVPPGDDLRLSFFIFLLTAEMPKLLKHPNSQLLKNLCLGLRYVNLNVPSPLKPPSRKK